MVVGEKEIVQCCLQMLEGMAYFIESWIPAHDLAPELMAMPQALNDHIQEAVVLSSHVLQTHDGVPIRLCCAGLGMPSHLIGIGCMPLLLSLTVCQTFLHVAQLVISNKCICSRHWFALCTGSIVW